MKVPLQNNKNWASPKCLVRKSEKMCLSHNLGMWNSKNDTFGAVMYLSFTYAGFPTGVPNMGGSSSKFDGRGFQKKIVRCGGCLPPSTMGNPDISQYTRK